MLAWSTNVQNIFATFSPLTIDSTVTGKTKNFSDFIVTAVTSAATGLSISSPSAAYGTTAPVTVTATSVNGIPTGIVSLVVDNNPALTSPLAANPANSASAATFNLSGLTAGSHQLTLTYPTTSYFLGNTATGSILITKATATPTVSAAPNPAPITTPVLVSLAMTNAQGSGVPTGTFSVTSSVSGDPSCSGTLASGNGACSLTFLTPGARTLTIIYPGDSNFGGLSTTVPETVNASPVASVSTNSLNFGTFYLGGIGLQSVTLTNTGDAVMTLNDPFLFDVGNGDSKEFIAVNLCPKSLAVGKSCSIYILFIAGPSYTPQTAILKIMDNAPGNPQTVNLLATVINPRASFSPSPLKFGATPVGTPTTAPLTLKNTGATPLTITGISVGGANAGDFSQTNTCPAQLAAGASCSLTVSFVPAKTGTRTAAVVLTGNLQNGSQTLALSGTGK